MATSLKKVIWAEGVLLGQQHFQQWDNYYQAERQIYNNCIAPKAWGLINLQIDEEALLNNHFRITHCAAIYPNGLLINYAATEDPVLNCELSVNNNDKLSIYLCVPINQHVAGITGYHQSEQNATWQADYQTITDMYDSDREREILFGKLNLRLLQEHEAHEQFHSLKIAELVSIGEHGWQIFADFIPSAVQIKAVPFLNNMLTRLLEIITAKIRVLNEHRYEQNNAIQILLLTILNNAFMRLQHIAKHPETHPEQLFIALSDLVSSLEALTPDFSLYNLPNYQHANLTETFIKLNKVLITTLDAVMPTRMATIKLRRESDSLYMADSIDNSLLTKADFFIAVYFAAEDTAWIEQFARQVKVGSHTMLESLVTSALPGVKIIHTQRPPNKLSIKPGYEYFYLEQLGSFWDQVKHDRSLGIFLPFAFAKANIELVTVQKS